MKHKGEGEQRRSTVKRGLNKLLRPYFREKFKYWVEKYCIQATRITVLASMLLLYYVNKAVDESGAAADEFFASNGKTVVRNCFLSILNENAATLPYEFLWIVRKATRHMIWPVRGGMGNIFNALIDMYMMNVTTNIKTHAKQHIKKFFRMKQYELNQQLRLNGFTDDNLISASDVDGAVKAVYFHYRFDRPNTIKAHNINMLIEEAVKIGVPITVKLCNVVKDNWFASIRWLIKIQREVDEFHMKYSYLFSL